jgi:hypothetical protein
MGNKKIFEQVKKLNLPKGKYVIFGSAPMGIRGIRDCHDLDIVVLEEVLEEIKKKPDWKVKNFENGRQTFVFGDIELWKDWWPGQWDTEDLIKRADIIDDLPFATLEDVLRWKKIFGRKKDWQDIQLIKKYLKKKK